MSTMSCDTIFSLSAHLLAVDFIETRKINPVQSWAITKLLEDPSSIERR